MAVLKAERRRTGCAPHDSAQRKRGGGVSGAAVGASGSVIGVAITSTGIDRMTAPTTKADGALTAAQASMNPHDWVRPDDFGAS